MFIFFFEKESSLLWLYHLFQILKLVFQIQHQTCHETQVLLLRMARYNNNNVIVNENNKSFKKNW